MARGRGGIEMRIDGVGDLRKAIEANADAVQYALGRALWEAGTTIGNESQELVPIDTGNLKGSMSYDVSGIGTSSPVVEIRYGTPYALYQHEKLELFHPARDGNSAGRRGTGPTAPGTAGGSPKYLEFPFLEETSQYPTKLVDRVQRHLDVIESRGRA